ncbi:uncharacterized protein BT62DRAFT_1012784 [Guyanagaster necrorhizus]|uniref:Uncharacterized protein n=1 Tax=Guyanagaster necrorhizus TaxID=856835 RepID=A0A9P7VHE2_9AGAR|nr:uncharacterized protein BT62DRAFT_1012784 [Guyanagaster necrorhizus MCA 3950]KAG7440415.1 hypothetical protein BT62DRAFT_1012784 [Guyanagaster necrorhizus MCA 3950]
MLYHSLRYLSHNDVGPGLRNKIATTFDVALDVGNGQWVGGIAKAALAQSLTHLRPDFRFDCGPFNEWIKHTLRAINQWRIAQIQKAWQSEVSTVSLDTEPAVDLKKKPVFHDHSPLHYQLESRGNKRPSEDSAQRAPKRRKSGCFTPAAASDNAATPA